MSTKPQSCKTCRWLDVPPTKAGAVVVRPKFAYKCLAPAPSLDAIHLPASITGYFNFHWPPARRSMSGDNGAECPTHERRTK